MKNYTRYNNSNQQSRHFNFEEILNLISHQTGFIPQPGNNGNYKTLCPAHNDKSPSLSIKQVENGKILIKCFANCSLGEICAAIGINVSQLFPKVKV